MENMNSTASRRQDEWEIMELLGKLPPEYVRKVKIYARTLYDIFMSRK